MSVEVSYIFSLFEELIKTTASIIENDYNAENILKNLKTFHSNRDDFFDIYYASSIPTK